MKITFCFVSIALGILFIIIGIGGTIRLRIPLLGYIGGPSGLIFILAGLLFQIGGAC